MIDSTQTTASDPNSMRDMGPSLQVEPEYVDEEFSNPSDSEATTRDDELFSIPEKEEGEEKELSPDEALDFIQQNSTAERLMHKQKKDRIKAILKGKDALLKKEDDEISVVSGKSNASHASRHS